MQSNHPKGPSHNSGGFSPRELDSIYYWLPETSEAPLYPHKDAVLISRDLLKRTYFETFNFYFSKPINEILANLSLPHVILYRDYLYYDDENEYLKRYYRLDESFPRIQNLSKFYSNTSEGLTKPNLAVHEQNKIILKRNNKLHKYYINKLQNFADIPQTQRDPHPNEDFRILNNLHDDDGYSEDIYSHERRRKANEERYVPEHQQHEHEGGVHNSFQQMLEKYEEATAKVSFESNQHDMYDPENSSASPRAENRSENISFDRSAEFSMKLQDKDFNMFQRQVLMEARPSDRGDERLHDGHRDHEDQIPHNLSNFALSDASDLHFINDMIRSSVDDNLTGALNNNYIRETVHAYAEKTKVPVHERQKENEEVEKEKIKPTTLATKSHATKSKSTSTNHIPNKQSDSMPKKMKIPLEKAKTLKEPDSAPVHGEKPLKSIERNLHSDKGAIQAFISTKREKEDATLDKSQRSARNTDVFEKMSPRDLQYPALSLKNIPISQVKQQIENGKKPSEVKMSATPYDDKNFFNKNRKSAPQAGKKSSGSYKKLSIPGDLKASLEKSPTPVNSAQYIQGLMEKYQKNMEEGHNKSKESTKDTHGAKSKASGDEIERPPKVNELYANTELYAKVAKKAEPKTHHHLSRSKTDEALLKDLYQNRPKTLLKTSPTKVLNNQPASARTVVLSPTNPRKEKMVHRFGSNEGLSPRLFNSSTNKLITQLSSENCKSLAENFPEDRFYSTSGNYKSMKIEKIFAYKRTEMKPPMKSAAAQKSDASNNLSTNMRRLTAAHTYSGTSSVEKNDLNSVPVSPTKKFDLKLNLNRLNQMPNRHQKEASTENSYGFWTSRSARLGPDEESKHLKQSGGTTEERYKNDSSKKEYLLKKNYEPYLETKKKGKTIKKGGSFTNRGITHGLKTREGEGTRNPNLLKSAAHESDLHHMFVQDLHEVNSAGRANILRGGEARLDLNSARNESGRHKK